MNEQQRAVVQQALEVLKRCQMNEAYRNFEQESHTITALQQLLETEPVQSAERGEPVAWIFKPNRELLWPDEVERENPIELDEYEALYTTPPAQPAAWVGLTDYEIGLCSTEAAMNRSQMVGGAVTFARAIEVKLREKNGGKA
jgi:hypothetical protein